MKIVRDGKEYELTRDELVRAWREERRNGDIEELDYWLDWFVSEGAIDKEEADKMDLNRYADDYREQLDCMDNVNERINEFTIYFVEKEILGL